MIRDHVVFFFFNNWSNVDVVIRRQNYVTFRFSSVSTHTLGLLLSCRASERLWQLCLPCLFGSSLQCTLEGVQLRYVFSSLSVFLFILNFNLDYWGFIGTSAAVRWQRVVTTKSSCFHLRSSIGWYSCSDLRTLIQVCCLPLCCLRARIARSFFSCCVLSSRAFVEQAAGQWSHSLPGILIYWPLRGVWIDTFRPMLVYPTSIKSNFICSFFSLFQYWFPGLWNRRNLPRWSPTDICFFVYPRFVAFGLKDLWRQP